MLSTGNGAPPLCALNLLRTVRGEVPYARTKGIGREHVDAPLTEGRRLGADAEWVIRSYEPRVRPGDVDVTRLAGGEAGDAAYTVGLTPAP